MVFTTIIKNPIAAIANATPAATNIPRRPFLASDHAESTLKNDITEAKARTTKPIHQNVELITSS